MRQRYEHMLLFGFRYVYAIAFVSLSSNPAIIYPALIEKNVFDRNINGHLCKSLSFQW